MESSIRNTSSNSPKYEFIQESGFAFESANGKQRIDLFTQPIR